MNTRFAQDVWIYILMIETNSWAKMCNAASSQVLCLRSCKTKPSDRRSGENVLRVLQLVEKARRMWGAIIDCNSRTFLRSCPRVPRAVLVNLNRLQLKVFQLLEGLVWVWEYHFLWEVSDLRAPPYHKIDHVYHLMNHISNIFPVTMNFLIFARCFVVKNASARNWPASTIQNCSQPKKRQGYKRQERKGKGGKLHDDRSVVTADGVQPLELRSGTVLPGTFHGLCNVWLTPLDAKANMIKKTGGAMTRWGTESSCQAQLLSHLWQIMYA